MCTGCVRDQQHSPSGLKCLCWNCFQTTTVSLAHVYTLYWCAVIQVRTSLEKHDNGHGREIYKQVQCCYALGDCCANMEQPLPALAQVGLLASCILQSLTTLLSFDAMLQNSTAGLQHLIEGSQ